MPLNTYFIYDYLKIEDVVYGAASKFIGAYPNTAGFSNIYVDTLKTAPVYNYHLSKIESIGASTSGNEIYLFDSYYDTTTVQGNMKGMPVGVEYLGQDFKSVTLSFPLYYMKQDQAKSLMTYILTNKFDLRMILIVYKLGKILILFEFSSH